MRFESVSQVDTVSYLYLYHGTAVCMFCNYHPSLDQSRSRLITNYKNRSRVSHFSQIGTTPVKNYSPGLELQNERLRNRTPALHLCSRHIYPLRENRITADLHWRNKSFK